MSVGVKESNLKLTTHNRGECRAQENIGCEGKWEKTMKLSTNAKQSHNNTWNKATTTRTCDLWMQCVERVNNLNLHYYSSPPALLTSHGTLWSSISCSIFTFKAHSGTYASFDTQHSPSTKPISFYPRLTAKIIVWAQSCSPYYQGQWYSNG